MIVIVSECFDSFCYFRFTVLGPAGVSQVDATRSSTLLTRRSLPRLCVFTLPLPAQMFSITSSCQTSKEIHYSQVSTPVTPRLKFARPLAQACESTFCTKLPPKHVQHSPNSPNPPQDACSIAQEHPTLRQDHPICLALPGSIPN